MRNITDYIGINENLSKIEPDKLAQTRRKLSAAQDNDGNYYVIIGCPFATERDEAYIMAKKWINSLGCNIAMDIEDVYDNYDDDIEFFVFAMNCYSDDNSVSCYAYSTDGEDGTIFAVK